MIGFAGSPFWDAERNSIYYVDSNPSVASPQLFRFDVDKNEFYSANIKNEESLSPSFCFPIEGAKDLFLVGLGPCAYIINWNGYSSEAYKTETVACVEKEFGNHAINFAKNDPTGRVYFGTSTNTSCDPSKPFNCALYSLDECQGLRKRVSGLKVSDGMAWSLEGNYFYHIESCFYNIREFYWDPHSGVLC